MNRELKSNQSRKVWGYAGGVLALLLTAGAPALAQAGQTEVTKTPSVAAQPRQQQNLPVTATAPQPAQQGTANWQANISTQKQPPQPALMSDGDVVAKVNAYFNGLIDLQGVFQQTDPDNSQKQGRFYFQRPGKALFAYGAPSQLRIVSDGSTLAIEDRSLQTSDRYPLDMTPFRLLLAEKVDLANDANIIAIDQGPDAVIMTVEDKKSDSAGRIRLFFNKPDMHLTAWIITDQQGLDTKIELTNVEENKKVAAELFEFDRSLGFRTNE